MRELLVIVTLCISLTSALDQVLTLNKITRTLVPDGDLMRTEDVDHFEIEVTGSVETFDHFHLNIHTTDGDEEFQGNSVADLTTKDKAVFRYNLADQQGKEVIFFLSQRDSLGDDNALSYGAIKFTIPVFPVDVVSTWVGVNDDYSLRIKDKGSIGDFKVDGKTCTETTATANEPCYFVDVTKDPEGELCTEAEYTIAKKQKVNVCDRTFTPEDVTSSVNNPVTTELKYAADGASATITVPVSTKGIAATEVIAYKEGKPLSVHACSGSPCSIGTSKANDIFTVITVDIDDSSNSLPVNTGSSTLTDYGLVGTVLSNSLIETRWTRQDSEDAYFASIGGSGAADFKTTKVTCKDADNGADFHCFAYFTGLDQETTYPLTVQIGADDTDPLSVTLTDTTTGKDAEEIEMELSSLTTKWNKGLRSLEVNACVHLVDSTDISSYEAILINNIGQWKKIHGLSQRSTNEFCFEKFNVDVHTFDLSENLALVVVKRAMDGITVLESVETVLSV